MGRKRSTNSQRARAWSNNLEACVWLRPRGGTLWHSVLFYVNHWKGLLEFRRDPPQYHHKI